MLKKYVHFRKPAAVPIAIGIRGNAYLKSKSICDLSVTRKLYYALPPSLRYVARYISYTPVDLLDTALGKRNKNIPPKRLIYTGGGDFLAIGKKIVDHIRKHELLTASSNVLDIGSGIGRIALPLTGHITSGRYEGFDIIRTGVRWCQKNITGRFPHFNFKWTQLAN